jgi:hypothetical protein
MVVHAYHPSNRQLKIGGSWAKLACAKRVTLILSKTSLKNISSHSGLKYI